MHLERANWSFFASPLLPTKREEGVMLWTPASDIWQCPSGLIGEEKYLFLLPLLDLYRKDRLTREKHTNLLKFMCHRNLHKEIKTKTMVKPEFFTLHLMRVESDGKVLQDKKQYNLRGVNRGKLSKASLFKSFFSFGDRHSISYMRSYDMLQGEIRKSRTCHFSNSFILRQSTCQDAIFGDSMS